MTLLRSQVFLNEFFYQFRNSLIFKGTLSLEHGPHFSIDYYGCAYYIRWHVTVLESRRHLSIFAEKQKSINNTPARRLAQQRITCKHAE